MRLQLGLLIFTLAAWVGHPGPVARAANLDQQLNIQPHNATQGRSRDVADQWMQLGNQQLSAGQLDQATQSWAEAAEIYRLLGDSQGQGLAYSSLGTTYATLGRYPEAEQALNRRMAVAADNNDPLGQVYALNNLGTIYLNQGRINDGQARFEAALQLARPTGEARAIGVSLSNLGLVATQRGDLEAAVKLLEAATNYRALASDYLGEAHSSNSLGDVYVALGRDSNAIGAYRVALRAGAEAEDRALQLRALDGLLGIYMDRDALTDAKPYLDRRLALTLPPTEPDVQTVITLRWLGDYYMALGNDQRAEEFYSRGLGLARELGNKPLEAELTNRLLGF